MTRVIGIQRRMMPLGKVRLGDKGPKGEPRKLTTFRLTSASRALLEEAAAAWGGEVREWVGAPDEGYYEVTTGATELPIILPPVFSDRDGQPTVPYSQFYELWSAGGCQRRCDGLTESLSGKPCLCGEDRGTGPAFCKITTRVNFMLPDLSGLGVWVLESHGYNAAVELPGTLDVLQMAAAEQKFIDAKLRVEERSRKTDGQTRRFIVPVIDLPGLKIGELLSGEQRVINPPAAGGPKPALNAGTPEPNGDKFENDSTPGFGESVEVVFDPEEEVGKLTNDLYELADQLGALDATIEAVTRNRDEHAEMPTRHLTYLRGQITRARNSLEAKEQT